ncbi:hypothetical protein [Corynebacterium lubricantis]|uniref:hypothetical protein n=1 Tax=Corynebacterium lubricantis TaxID=541095 RepID=UPI00037701E0|nr:hypothetical protein [Corynebacterium lubricantis]
MNLNSKDKGWFGIVIAVWVIILAVLIFILPKGNAGSAGQSSLSSTLNQITPATGPALMADAEINPADVYGDEYQGILTLCSNEPPELQQIKLELVGQDLDLGGDYDYVLLLPMDQNAEIGVDQVSTDQIQLCPEFEGQSAAMQQAIPMNTPLPFYKDGEAWTLGYRI